VNKDARDATPQNTLVVNPRFAQATELTDLVMQLDLRQRRRRLGESLKVEDSLHWGSWQASTQQHQAKLCRKAEDWKRQQQRRLGGTLKVEDSLHWGSRRASTQ
jgi:hypothetical protein